MGTSSGIETGVAPVRLTTPLCCDTGTGRRLLLASGCHVPGDTHFGSLITLACPVVLPQAKRLLEQVSGLQDTAWARTLQLLPPGCQLADPTCSLADLPVRFLAAWLATQLQPAWYDPLSYILPQGGGLVGLPYGDEGGGLNEQEANTLQLLYGHAARRLCDVVAEAAEGVHTATAGAVGCAPHNSSLSRKALWDAVESITAAVAHSLADDLHAANPTQLQSPQLLGSLQRLALHTLRLGLLVRASHPLLRMCVTPLPPGQGQGSQGPQGQQWHRHGQGQQGELQAAGVPKFREDRHVEVRSVRVTPPRPQTNNLSQPYYQQQQVQDGDRGATSGSSTCPPRVLFTVRPGACYVPAAGFASSHGGGGGDPSAPTNSRWLVQEDVVTWVWVQPLLGAPGDTHLQRREEAALRADGCAAATMPPAGSVPGDGRGGVMGQPEPVGAGGRADGTAGPPPAPATPPRESLAAGGMDVGGGNGHACREGALSMGVACGDDGVLMGVGEAEHAG